MASVAIITGPAPAELSWLHERAPLAVPESMFPGWLAADGSDAQPIVDTLTAVGYPELDWYPVSRAIGQVRDKGAHLMEPAAPAQEVTPITLF